MRCFAMSQASPLRLARVAMSPAPKPGGRLGRRRQPRSNARTHGGKASSHPPTLTDSVGLYCPADLDIAGQPLGLDGTRRRLLRCGAMTLERQGAMRLQYD